MDLAALAARHRAPEVERAGRQSAASPSTVGSDARCTSRGDRDRLVQLMTILLDNAIDHSPSGGPDHGHGPSIGGDQAEVGGRGRRARASRPADRERIFEPFARLPGVRRDRAGGTGLGLAIARRIVEAHGGTIQVDPAWTAGARFVVRLPSTG